MQRRLVVWSCWSFMLLVPSVAAAQTSQNRTTTLSSVFQNLFGPNGLVVDSQAVLPDGSTHSAHFNSAFQSNFTQFNVALASQLTSLPLPSPASGFTYRFDQGTGTFIRSTQSFGPILTDRAETIGRGRFSFGYTYQFFSFDQLEGIDLTRVPSVFTHDDFQLGGGRTDVVTTRNTIDASVGQWTGALTYGLTDRLDLSVAVPIVSTHLEVISAATIERVGTLGSPNVHFFADPDAPGGFGSERTFSAGGSASGIGDIIMRLKGSLLRSAGSGLSVGVDVRAPTGDERNLLGSGAAGVKPFVAASWTLKRFAPRVNLGYQWNGSSVLAGDPETGRKADLPDQGLYAVGADFGVSDRFSLTGDWLGRYAIDSPRVSVHTFTPAGSPVGFDDMIFGTSSYWASSAAMGCKANVGGRVLIDFNLRFTVDNNGLTDRVTPLIGVEYGFK